MNDSFCGDVQTFLVEFLAQIDVSESYCLCQSFVDRFRSTIGEL